MENSAPDANAGSGESSAPETQSTTGHTPEPANVSQESTESVESQVQGSEKEVPFHEHPRWKEVLEERNGYKNELAAIRAKLDQAIPQPQRVDPIKAYRDNLVKKGVDEEVADLIVQGAVEAAKSTVRPLEQKSAAQELASWKSSLSQTHKDFVKYEDKMAEVYMGLPDHMKDLVVSGPQGYEMLYLYAKGKSADKLAQDEYQRGANEAYKNRAAKAALSSTPGASSANSAKLTKESIFNMPNDKATLKQIWERRTELLD